ncbi:MAG: zinc-ribbon domain-containing protein [Myxococcota bacterium]
MIVTCERCATQFQLDDTRVPVDGVRVRCSRCKHAFMVEPIAKTEIDRVHQAARRALREEAFPGVTEDMPEGEAAEAAAPADALDDSWDDEESDWEFNDDLPEDFADEDPAPASEDDPPALGEVGFADDGPVPDLASDPLPPLADEGTPAASEAPTPVEAAAPVSAETAPIDTDAENDAGESVLTEAELDAGLGLGPASSDAPAALPDLEPPSAEPAAPAPLPEAKPEALPPAPAEALRDRNDDSSDELGSPVDWDIFDEAPAAAPVREQRAAAPIEVVQDDADGELQLDDDDSGRFAARLGAGVGWCATLALVAVGLFAGLYAPQPPLGDVELAPGVMLENVEHRWVDHASFGPVFVVSGVLRNASDGSLAVPDLALELRDGAGNGVGRALPLGAPRSSRVLRQGDRDALRSAGSFRRPLGRGESRAFEVVVQPLPEKAARFVVRDQR